MVQFLTGISKREKMRLMEENILKPKDIVFESKEPTE